MTREEIAKVLENHKHWLEGDWPGWENRANLSETNLEGIDLSGANLREADLHGAILRKAVLKGANLSGAVLYGADLSEANLAKADLSGANLCDTNLVGTDLSNSILYDAELIGADLSNSYLWEASLWGANLNRANIRGSYIEHAHLNGAVLTGAINLPFIPLACPEAGSFIGWKKCIKYKGICIVKLLIPEDAKRTSATTRKCRCDKAQVLEIQTINGDILPPDVIAYSCYGIHNNGRKFPYKVGEIVKTEEPFEEDRWKECASGIHFFINRQDAVEYPMI